MFCGERNPLGARVNASKAETWVASVVVVLSPGLFDRSKRQYQVNSAKI
jgi:hypothetical protein